jgi:hypothetical protein
MPVSFSNCGKIGFVCSWQRSLLTKYLKSYPPLHNQSSTLDPQVVAQHLHMQNDTADRVMNILTESSTAVL